MISRTLAQWLAYLEQLHPSAIDMGLARVREVAQRLGLALQLAPRVITVTGTNGKGSTCAFLTQLLTDRGLRVGLYASPHLRAYNERVQIAGVPVADVDLCMAFAQIEAARGEVSLTYFEMGTLAAFWLFQQARLDALVLEVGLGGRLDAVNIVDTDLAIVTSIGLDHAEWLGDTRDSVAYEKAGIFRMGKPVICGDSAPPSTLLQQAAALHSPLWLAGRDFTQHAHANGWDWQGLDAQRQPVTLKGLPSFDLPKENAALALQAMFVLGLPLSAVEARPSLMHTRLVGRLERRRLNYAGRSLKLLLDVGHNPHAAHYLAKRLQEQPPLGRRMAVFGLLADKDLAGVLAPLAPLVAQWQVVTLPTARARAAQDLQAALVCQGANVSVAPSVADALTALCQAASVDDEILVFGSFYCVAQALDWLEQHPEVNNGIT